MALASVPAVATASKRENTVALAAFRMSQRQIFFPSAPAQSRSRYSQISRYAGSDAGEGQIVRFKADDSPSR
jgi:hypothetical protein